MKLRAQKPTRFRLISVPAGFVCRWDKQATSENAVLSVKWEAHGGGKTLLQSQIVAATDDVREPRIVIPVYAATNASGGVCSPRS